MLIDSLHSIPLSTPQAHAQMGCLYRTDARTRRRMDLIKRLLT